ncbi:hypothetical protein [Chryseobacterium lathyri]|uniref:hypothetical protein n=1 Tax=Chryseobacterium lathyri TaxID=395933 RepID=UPI0027840022|nr:hypothetical protein [Chryseobacterium lathyri]MDQ0064564.1 hypothetical protein [Chryseobacterium lathyri]
MKKILFASMFIFSCFAFAQEVKLKKDAVYVDNKECLKVVSNNSRNFVFTTLDKQRLFSFDYIITGENREGFAAGYVKVYFFETNEVLTFKNNRFTKKVFIQNLINDKVLDNCALNIDNIKGFIQRYNEHYEESIIRSN